MIVTRQIGEKGQVVIPRDIRQMLNLQSGSKVIFEVEKQEVKLKKKKDERKILEEFFTIARTKGKDVTLEELKRIEDESYDLS
jgi:AbrB family looped-hinge helix DNA binding protein